MTSVAQPVGTQLEITKLAATLDIDPDQLTGLAQAPATEIRRVRLTISRKVSQRHEHRFHRLASLVKLVPLALAAGIAERALGPMISARVASALDTSDAVRLAGHLDSEFLTNVALHLDPDGVEGIVGALPGQLVVDVGRRLLARNELTVLGGLVSVVGVTEALKVAEKATGEQLLQIALFTDEVASLDALVTGLTDGQMSEVIRAAAVSDHLDETVQLVAVLSVDNVTRLLPHVLGVDLTDQDRFVLAVHRQSAWSSVLPALARLEQGDLHGLVNLPALARADVLDAALDALYAGGDATLTAPVVLGFDDEHLDVLSQLPTLQRPEVQQWLTDNVGKSPRLVRAILRDLDLT